MKVPVSLHSLPDYNSDSVSEALHNALTPFGGIETFVKPGHKVLIKPNMLAGKTPEKAVTTHPEIVKQVIYLVQKAGGIATVGDSPGLGSLNSVARKSGIHSAIEETGAQLAAFTESVPIKTVSGTFHHLEVAKEALDNNVIINLPKLKTHQMMGFTGAVKNLFGLVVGMRKAKLHLQAGTDKTFFALMLLELAEYFKPALSIMDAVVGMEGNGPGSGDPVHIGALLASKNPLALDTAAIELVRLPAEKVWTQFVAQQSGRCGAHLEELDLLGIPLAKLQIQNFKPAKTTDINFGLPKPLKDLLKNTTTAHPEIGQACVACGECVRQCPPQAISISPRGLKIDFARCIRCFCCQELCPHAAITTRQGLLLRLSEFVHGHKHKHN